MIKNQKYYYYFQVRMQTMPLPAPGQSPMYAGAIDCVKKTLANEGPKGLYKGKKI